VPFYPTDASNLNAGDTVLVIASFRFRINGGSGSDEYSFRVEATNGYSATSTSTGALQDLRDHRGKWQLVTFQRVININTQPSGDVRFYLQVFMSDADDDINVNNLHMTIVKF
jgi:hypothetical protein